jgi:hypothetical protein
MEYQTYQGKHQHTSCLKKDYFISEVHFFREDGFVPAENTLCSSQLNPLFIAGDEAVQKM